MGFLTTLGARISATVFLAALAAGCSGSAPPSAPASEPRAATYGGTSARSFAYDYALGRDLEPLWESEVKSSSAPIQPTSAGDYLFITDLSGEVTRLDLATGKTLGDFDERGGALTSAALAEGALFAAIPDDETPTTDLVAYDYDAWRSLDSRNVEGYLTLEPVVVPGGVLYLSGRRAIKATRDLDSAEFFELETPAYGSPAFDGKTLAYGTEKGAVVFYDYAERRERARIELGAGPLGPCSIYDGAAYVCSESGTLFAVSIERGEELWRAKVGTRVVAPPTAVAERVFSAALSGEVVCLDRATGEEVWRFVDGEAFGYPALVFADAALVLDVTGALYILDRNTGRLVQEFDIGGRPTFAPAAIAGTLVVGYERGNVRAYAIR
jgi:outer membrane protein assembly factor BamB